MPSLSRTCAVLALCVGGAVRQPASRSKTLLQEHCQKVRIALPEYSLTGTDGPAHLRKFQAAVMVANDTYTGTWQHSIKAAEGSAAEMALRSVVADGVEVPSPAKDRTKDRPKLVNPYPEAINELLRVCRANEWPEPCFTSQPRDGVQYVETLSVSDGSSEWRFDGRSTRLRVARSIASESAMAVLRDELALPPTAIGAMASLRGLSARRGLALRASANGVLVGGKSRVLRLMQEATGPSSSGVEDCPTWSGLGLSAVGRGLTRAACLDEAAWRVLGELQRTAVSGALTGAVMGSRMLARSVGAVMGAESEVGAVCAPYFPRQRVLVTNLVSETDRWVREHALGQQGMSRVVAFDSEWQPNGDEAEGVTLVQLATEDACLLVHGDAVRGSRALRELLRSTSVLKVGKDLREDWRRLRPLLLDDSFTDTTRPRSHEITRDHGHNSAEITVTTRVNSAEASVAGWVELVSFLPLHDQTASLDELTRTFLGVEYTMKGTVNHETWGVWPLSEPMRSYAAADVCAVMDVLQAVERMRREEAEAVALARARATAGERSADERTRWLTAKCDGEDELASRASTARHQETEPGRSARSTVGRDHAIV